MGTKKLSSSNPYGSINPFFIRSLPSEGIVKNGKVEVRNETLLFDDEPYPEGTKVQVNIGRNLYCYDVAERENELLAYAARIKERVDKRNEAVKVFNQSLNVPVSWKPEIKRVMSGLQRNVDRDWETS